jgi:hypothetical protein
MPTKKKNINLDKSRNKVKNKNISKKKRKIKRTSVNTKKKYKSKKQIGGAQWGKKEWKWHDRDMVRALTRLLERNKIGYEGLELNLNNLSKKYTSEFKRVFNRARKEASAQKNKNEKLEPTLAFGKKLNKNKIHDYLDYIRRRITVKKLKGNQLSLGLTDPGYNLNLKKTSSRSWQKKFRPRRKHSKYTLGKGTSKLKLGKGFSKKGSPINKFKLLNPTVLTLNQNENDYETDYETEIDYGYKADDTNNNINLPFYSKGNYEKFRGLSEWEKGKLLALKQETDSDREHTIESYKAHAKLYPEYKNLLNKLSRDGDFVHLIKPPPNIDSSSTITRLNTKGPVSVYSAHLQGTLPHRKQTPKEIENKLSNTLTKFYKEQQNRTGVKNPKRIKQIITHLKTHYINKIKGDNSDSDNLLRKEANEYLLQTKAKINKKYGSNIQLPLFGQIEISGNKSGAKAPSLFRALRSPITKKSYAKGMKYRLARPKINTKTKEKLLEKLAKNRNKYFKKMEKNRIITQKQKNKHKEEEAQYQARENEYENYLKEAGLEPNKVLPTPGLLQYYRFTPSLFNKQVWKMNPGHWEKMTNSNSAVPRRIAEIRANLISKLPNNIKSKYNGEGKKALLPKLLNNKTQEDIVSGMSIARYKREQELKASRSKALKDKIPSPLIKENNPGNNIDIVPPPYHTQNQNQNQVFPLKINPPIGQSEL